MASPVLVPLAEYLNTAYRPDRDYLEGETRERNMGEKPHGLLQGILFSIFQANRRAWNLLPLLEQRVQTSPDRYRIPDLCLVRPGDTPGPIVEIAPMLCVEIQSRGDSLATMQERVDDYAGMGVTSIWLIDPILRQAYLGSRNGFERLNGVLAVEGTLVCVDLDLVFAELEDLLAGRL